jgi:glycosyltransferase involved in cell wall biosynthesis
MAEITFIIPSIGRPTLPRSIDSLKKLNINNWKAIIIFDGIDPTIEEKDSRITMLKIPKTGFKNCAGNVRNYGISKATTDWVAFLDDDDVITRDYLDKFYEELEKNTMLDVIIFRMRMMKKILPSPSVNIFRKCEVGISFCLKKSIFTEENFWFVPSNVEDFELLDILRKNNKNITISQHVTYIVRP